jgi:hypothetical protein
MSIPPVIDQNVAMGQIALALTLEHLRERQAAGELTEAQVSTIVNRAISRFEPQAQPHLRTILAKIRAI